MDRLPLALAEESPCLEDPPSLASCGGCDPLNCASSSSSDGNRDSAGRPSVVGAGLARLFGGCELHDDPEDDGLRRGVELIDGGCPGDRYEVVGTD
jgi:hypothetical protein